MTTKQVPQTSPEAPSAENHCVRARPLTKTGKSQQWMEEKWQRLASVCPSVHLTLIHSFRDSAAPPSRLPCSHSTISGHPQDSKPWDLSSVSNWHSHKSIMHPICARSAVGWPCVHALPQWQMTEEHTCFSATLLQPKILGESLQDIRVKSQPWGSFFN